MTRTLLLFLTLSHIQATQAQKPVTLRSPDKNLTFAFTLSKGEANYTVGYHGKPVILKSPLSVSYQDISFSNGLEMGRPKFSDGRERYTLKTGKTSSVDEPFNAVSIPLTKRGTDNQLTLEVRAFNDGVAFRYRFEERKDAQELVLTDEHDAFNLPAATTVRALFLPTYTTSHEGLYHAVKIEDIRADTLIDLPLLAETPDHIYIGITESNLLDYAGMYLSRVHGELRSMLSPLPGQTVVKVKAALPHQSPWRVMMVSDRVGALLESNLVTNLAEPCRVKDLSWIRPGKTTFPWWNGNVLPDTINAPGNNFVTQKYYIDFCARNHIAYHSVVEYGLHEWYTSDGAGFVPGPHADVTKPVPGLDMKQVCDYAKSLGVGVRVWVYWTALYKDLEAAFTRFEEWGLSGMMVDFMDRDDQEMVNIQTRILERAAAHHLHIQFHGAYKPTGLSRTYPNEFTREGTLNYEVNKWEKKITPDHDLNIAFMRGMAGSTDYHLGGFRAVPDSLFRVQYTRPLQLGTRAHMLAMYIALENPLGMVCDYPEAYEGQDGFDFLQQVPTTWDQTKVISAKPEEHLAIARRKGGDWWIGAINDHDARTLPLNLDFLGEGPYEAEIWGDTPDARVHPNGVSKRTVRVTKADTITLNLAGGGGATVHIHK
jgi:alpha-glucosidase